MGLLMFCIYQFTLHNWLFKLLLVYAIGPHPYATLYILLMFMDGYVIHAFKY